MVSLFDDLNESPHARLPLPASDSPTGPTRRPTTQQEIFALIRDLGDSFIPSYLPVLFSRRAVPYIPHERRLQLIRRGRYVEFNLVYGRGTKFGLITPGARIESILVSLPESVRWESIPELGVEATEEGKLTEVSKNPRDWV